MTEYPQEVKQRLLGTPEQQASGLVGERPARWSSIVIVDPDPAWPERFEVERASIEAALGDLILGLEHVGSTSVPGLAAKPIIDIDLTLAGTSDESLYVPALEQIGYRLVLREPWWHGHRMLVGGAEDIHLHVWPSDSPELIRHRLFRDWLRSHPEDRDLYASVKRSLAGESTDYTMDKSDVIDQIFARIFAA